jgi:hypothetical protein
MARRKLTADNIIATANDLRGVIAASRIEEGIPTSLVNENTVTAATVTVLNHVLTSFFVAQGGTAMSGLVDTPTGTMPTAVGLTISAPVKGIQVAIVTVITAARVQWRSKQ